MSPAASRYYTAKDAITLTGLSKSKFYALAKSGVIVREETPDGARYVGSNLRKVAREEAERRKIAQQVESTRQAWEQEAQMEPSGTPGGEEQETRVPTAPGPITSPFADDTGVERGQSSHPLGSDSHQVRLQVASRVVLVNNTEGEVIITVTRPSIHRCITCGLPSSHGIMVADESEIYVSFCKRHFDNLLQIPL